MLRLILLRHAKSAWDDPRLADIDRPLADRGHEAAPLLGAFLARERLFPDRALVSTARRTRETLAAILPFLDRPMEITITRALYDAMEGDYLAIIRERGQDAQTLLVLGHNPATEETAVTLSARGPAPLLQAMRAKFPTGAAALIEIDAREWAAVAPGSGRLVAFIRPRDLGGTDGD